MRSPIAEFTDTDQRQRIVVLEVSPSGRDLRLKLKTGKKVSRSLASKLPKGLVDVATGEIIDQPIEYVKAVWATLVCKENNGWPLHILIDALPVENLGLDTALSIAENIQTFTKFQVALQQLREIDVPSSRHNIYTAASQLDYERRTLPDGSSVPTPGVSREFQNITINDPNGGQFAFRTVTEISVRPDWDPLTVLYPEPLAILMRVTSPSIWKSLRLWSDSDSCDADVGALMKFGQPLDFRKEDRTKYLKSKYS